MQGRRPRRRDRLWTSDVRVTVTRLPGDRSFPFGGGPAPRRPSRTSDEHDRVGPNGRSLRPPRARPTQPALHHAPERAWVMGLFPVAVGRTPTLPSASRQSATDGQARRDQIPLRTIAVLQSETGLGEGESGKAVCVLEQAVAADLRKGHQREASNGLVLVPARR